MGLWQDTRQAAETARQALWGTMLSYKGVEYPCEATAPEYKLEQERNAFMPKKPSTFTVFRADYLSMLAAGMKPREVIVSGGDNFQVYAINDDPSDATVDLRCTYEV